MCCSAPRDIGLMRPSSLPPCLPPCLLSPSLPSYPHSHARRRQVHPGRGHELGLRMRSEELPGRLRKGLCSPLLDHGNGEGQRRRRHMLCGPERVSLSQGERRAVPCRSVQNKQNECSYLSISCLPRQLIGLIEFARLKCSFHALPCEVHFHT